VQSDWAGCGSCCPGCSRAVGRVACSVPLRHSTAGHVTVADVAADGG
jgi:hypothetical protein